MVVSLILLLSLLGPAAWAEGSKKPEKPRYEYLGKPIQLTVACGDKEIAEFGMACSAKLPCPVYLELQSVKFINGKVFVAGNLHSDSATMDSVLLASEDGGLTWTEPAERLPRAGLERIEFYDENHGWALGYKLDGRPHDPFFLLTTDGGKIWRKRPIFDEGSAAEVQDFWFDSDRSGGLLVDLHHENEAGIRYARYETMTGAESWMIREMSATPLKRRRRIRPAPAEWRIATAKDTRAWAVQKREPLGWTTIAAFLVETGLCVPEPEVVAESPPEPEPKPAAAKPAKPEVAPGGVFVIGAKPPPPNPTQQAPSRNEDERPTIKKPKP